MESRKEENSAADRRPATVKDIAGVAGVSIGTLDRVLHNRGRVSEETAGRVWEAVERLRYSPNLVAKHLSKAEHRTFGVLMPWPEADSGYWQLIASGIDSAVGQLAHHYLSVAYFHFDRGDPDSFDTAAERLLTADVDGVILAPSFSDPSRKLVSRLGETPCVIFDGELPDTPVLTTVNQDSFESGLLAGKLLKLLAPDGPYLTVTLGAEDYHLRRRRDGFLAFFDRAGGGTVEHVTVEEAAVEHLTLKTVDGAAGETPLWAARSKPGREVGGVFVTNALAHLVAAELNGSGAEPRNAAGPGMPRRHIPIIGYDLIPENRDCLRRRLLDFVIHQEPQRQGFTSLYALYRRVVLEDEVEPRIAMPIDIIMPENLDFYADTRRSGSAVIADAAAGSGDAAGVEGQREYPRGKQT